MLTNFIICTIINSTEEIRKENFFHKNNLIRKNKQLKMCEYTKSE